MNKLNIVASAGQYIIFKSYGNGTREFARVVRKTNDLRQAKKYVKENAVPVNSVGAGGISGLDIGLIKKYKKSRMWRRKQIA